ncbi:MAG: DUF6543 domain-containing protein [Pseudomonas prosekii]
MDRQPHDHAPVRDIRFDSLDDLPRRDERLFLAAVQRWQDCRDEFAALMADAPDSAPRQRWDDWWNARARGTAVSRWTRAIELFRRHFDAAAQTTFAQGQLSAAQMQSVQALMNPAQLPAPLITERLGGTQVAQDAEWAAALLITTVSGPLLYLPARQPALLAFDTRAALQAHLNLEQLSQHTTDSIAPAIITDSPPDDPLLEALTRWRAHCVQAPQAWSRQRQIQVLFAAPPAPGDFVMSEVEDDERAVPLFGSLHADLSLSHRRNAIEQQRLAIESLLDDEQGVAQPDRLAALKRCFDALDSAEENARSAAKALLDRRPALRLLELRQRPNADYDALHLARLAGLRAEAEVQRLLRQISEVEQAWVHAALDNPKRADRSQAVMVARLSLAASPTLSTTLDGPLVITSETTGDALLLYWPGSTGGLQRFASLQALEHAVFKLRAIDSELSLQLSPLFGDPFEYSLQNQLYACEQRVARVLTDNPLATHERQRRVELEKCLLETLDSLGVPVHQAREQAYLDVLEQQQTHALAGHLPQWLSQASPARRASLKASVTAFIDAMKTSHALLERDLPQRDDFARKRVDERLRKDFSLTQAFSITLDLPDSTSWRKTLVEGAAPGTPQRNVLTASSQRSTLSIAQLAPGNIDQPLWLRLTFMKVEVIADSATEREALLQGVTLPYLRQLVTDLDLAGHYEGLIYRAFMGSTAATAFANEHRRECLTEPFRQMLKMRGDSALLQQQIQEDGWQILNIAIDANNAQAFAANGQRIVLRPVTLTVGGPDTDDGPTGLSGLTFIEEQRSGTTVLYLPDSPDGQFFHQRATLELARELLFNLCLRPVMVDYLAGRALKGDGAHHVSRINQARKVNFAALIGAGTAWPATTSLAAHLLNAHMGRLIEAHRATSRSNLALALERYALQGGALFNYLKMALGMLPFVGSAVALYDAWDSANLAAAAFLRGEAGHGLTQLESVLLSLIDAAMDILPGASASPGMARALTRQRQIKALLKGTAGLQRSSMRKVKHRLDQFAGYEYEGAVSLEGLQPHSDGVYRNVYRHASGDFILRQGRIYQVRLVDRTMRLSGTRARTYQQAIALDEAGQWDTRFALLGTLADEGLAGGGNLLGHLADGLEPMWPAAIRRWLPRWLTDRAAEHQRRLGRTIDALSLQLDAQHRRSNQAIRQYNEADPAIRRSTLDAVDRRCANDIELARQRHDHLTQMLAVSHGNRRQNTLELLSQSALVVVERYLHRSNLARDRCLDYLADIGLLSEQMLNLPAGNLRTSLRLAGQSSRLRLRLIEELHGIDKNMAQIELWRQRITMRGDKAYIAQELEHAANALSEGKRDYLKSLNYLPMLTRYDRVFDSSWIYLHRRMTRARAKVYDALNSQFDLPEVIANVHRRNQILGECIEVYDQFGRDLIVWAAGYSQHFDSPWIAPTLEQLKRMSNHARHGIKNGIKQSANARNSGKEIFETDGNRLMVGEKQIDPLTRQTRFTTTGEDGRVEHWLPASAGKYQRQVPPESLQPDVPIDRQALLREARQRLAAQDDYRRKVDGYARQNMLPADLDYMLTSEAAELRLRARRISRVAAQDPIVAQLHTKADELIRVGRDLRIEKMLSSTTPTEGYLHELHELAPVGQPLIKIRKVGTLVEQGRRADGRLDFLQEFEVLNLSVEPPEPLWYAHFHFNTGKPQFNRFDKAHLKTPAQRNLGLKWQQKQASTGAVVDSIWRGPIGKPFAEQYFAPLFDT